MSRFNFILVASLCLSACSVTKPYIDSKRNAGQPVESLYVGKSSPTHPVVCYNSWSTTVEEIKQLATDECIKQETGTTAMPIKTESFNCTFFAPNRVYFKCL